MFLTTNPGLAQASLLVFAVLLGWAALGDARDYMIPNKLVLAVALLFVPYALWSPEPINMLSTVPVAFVAFVIGIAMFARGLMGGGDVKLLAAISLWAGPALVFQFVIVTALAGGLLSLAMLPRIWSRNGAAAVARTPIPYGVAVSAGGIYVAARLLAGV